MIPPFLQLLFNALYSPITYDSLRYTEINNDLSIGSGKGWTNFMRWELGVRDQWIYFRTYNGEYTNSEWHGRTYLHVPTSPIPFLIT